jgi:hypothetical protein
VSMPSTSLSSALMRVNSRARGETSVATIVGGRGVRAQGEVGAQGLDAAARADVENPPGGRGQLQTGECEEHPTPRTWPVGSAPPARPRRGRWRSTIRRRRERPRRPGDAREPTARRHPRRSARSRGRPARAPERRQGACDGARSVPPRGTAGARERRARHCAGPGPPAPVRAARGRQRCRRPGPTAICTASAR